MPPAASTASCLRRAQAARQVLRRLRARVDDARFANGDDRRRVEDLLETRRLGNFRAHPADVERRRTGPPARRHVSAAERFALADYMWSGEAGRGARRCSGEPRRKPGGTSPLSRGSEWPELFNALLAPEILRPRFGRHPRLAIWGPLEARLQRADLLVLGGLNEGTWPPLVDSGPWINRPMRTSLGLPQPERRVGLSAHHDFATALAAERRTAHPRRARSLAPQVPSRRWARMDALFGL